MLTMESLWLFVLGGLLTGSGRHGGPNWIALLLAVLGGFWLARLMEHFDLPRRRLLALSIGASVVGLWIIGAIFYGSDAGAFTPAPLAHFFVDPERILHQDWSTVAGLIVLAVAWLRGALTEQSQRTYQSVLRVFTIGLIVVVVGLLFGRSAASSPAIDAAALPYFVVGLFALASVNLGQAEHISGDSWRGPWLLILAGSAGVLGLVGLAAGLVPLEPLRAAFTAVVVPIATLILAILDLLFYLLALPFALLINWLVAHLAGKNQPPLQPPPDIVSQAAQHAKHHAHNIGIVIAIFLAKLLLFAVLAAVLLLLFIWAFRRLRQGGTDEEERESVWVDGTVQGDLKALLDNLLGRFRHPAEGQEPALPARILAVRRLYLRMLARAEAGGLARPPAATPDEFAPVLTAHFASPAPETVSHRFSRARYGLQEPSADELSRLQDELKKLREG